MPFPEPREAFGFREFVLDVAAYELRRNGRPVRLERQPMDLLILLVTRRGQLVSRSEIVDALWGKDVFVDVETGVHTAVRKIRQALRDSADAPFFIETVAGKGYRFAATVEVVPTLPPPPAGEIARLSVSAPTGVDVGETVVPPVTPLAVEGAHAGAAAHRPRAGPPLVLGLLAAAAIAGVVVWGWSRAGDQGSRITIAVLPFENLSRNSDSNYLADGFAEDTIVSLGRLDPGRVSVVGRTSMIAYKGTTKSLAEIGREVGAEYIVEGSFRVESSQLRVAARLIRAREQIQVWSDSYDKDASSMLSVQQELSWAIAQQVHTRLSPDRQRVLARRQTQNAEAYDLFLRGREFFNQRTPAATPRAVEYYQRAIGLDPDYALAWSGLSMAHAASAINGDADPRDVRPLARDAAEQAVALNGDLAEAQHALGIVNWQFEWNWPVAEHALRRAVALDPSYSFAHVILGHLLSQSGRHAEAEPVMRRARDLDPLNPMSFALSSQVAFQARDYTAALELAGRSITLAPQFWIGYQMSGQAHERLGHDALALQALASAAQVSRQNSKPVSLSGYILGRAGRTAEARDVLNTLKTTADRYVPPYALALVHAGLGDEDALFDSLERAYRERDVHLMFLPVDPKWDPYREDPRFVALLAQCGFTATER